MKVTFPKGFQITALVQRNGNQGYGYKLIESKVRKDVLPVDNVTPAVSVRSVKQNMSTAFLS